MGQAIEQRDGHLGVAEDGGKRSSILEYEEWKNESGKPGPGGSIAEK